MSGKDHAVRAHSKFSASGAERWFNCSASVELSEGLPDKSSPWAKEGTQAHEVLEALIHITRSGNDLASVEEWRHVVDAPEVTREMMMHGQASADFILELGRKLKSEVLTETRVYLRFLHPEMFGTLDNAIPEHFGTLHVFDYKYGAGKAVSPVENLQMIFYAIALAHQYDWNFSRVRMWIVQPRIKGYDGPSFWEISIDELRAYVPQFKNAIDRVENNPTLNEGSWCHWCKAKDICPLKREAKLDKARLLFSVVDRTENSREVVYGEEKEGPEEISGQKEDEESEEDFF